MGVVVLSRHDLSFEVAMTNTTRDEAAEFFKSFRSYCAGKSDELPLESSTPAPLSA